MARERTVNKLGLAFEKDGHALILGSDAKGVRFRKPFVSEPEPPGQSQIAGVEDVPSPPAKCIVTASSFHGEMGAAEIADLISWLQEKYPSV